MTLTAKVRNVVGVEAATVDLVKVTLVAGLNGAGKTSLIQAIAAAATGNWQIRGVQHKRDCGKVVRAGAAEAVAILEYPGGSVRVAWPKGDVTQVGQPLDLGTPLGIGAKRFSELSADKRMAEITQRFRTAPARADYDAWFRSHPGAGVDPDAKARPGEVRAIDVLWDDIHQSGWDAISKRMDGAVRNLQGAWQEATGARWGSKLRLEWAPLGLHRGEAYSATEAAAAVKAAKDALEVIVADSAVDEAERRRLREVADQLPQNEAALDAAMAARDAINAEVDALLEGLEANPAPIDPAAYPLCPHCGQAVAVRRSPSAALVVEKAPPRPDLAEFEAAQRQRKAILDALATKRGEVAPAARAVAEAEAAFAASVKADADLDLVEQKPVIAAEEIVAARLAVTEAERHQRAVHALHRAIALNAEWEATKVLAEAVAPDGIRAAVFERRMAEIAAELGEVAASADMAEVALTTDGTLTYGGHPYDMASESEQWRCDFVMAAVMAKREGAKLFLLDRLDLLQPQSRPGIYRALAKLGIPSVVAMTVREPSLLKDFPAAVGQAMWLGGGKLQPINTIPNPGAVNG